MRTPIRQGYGKRKRHTDVSEIAWDMTIDKVTDDVEAQIPEQQSQTEPYRTPVLRDPERIAHVEVSVKSKPRHIPDVYDFESILPRNSKSRGAPEVTLPRRTPKAIKSAHSVASTSPRQILHESPAGHLPLPNGKDKSTASTPPLTKHETTLSGCDEDISLAPSRPKDPAISLSPDVSGISDAAPLDPAQRLELSRSSRSSSAQHSKSSFPVSGARNPTTSSSHNVPRTVTHIPPARPHTPCQQITTEIPQPSPQDDAFNDFFDTGNDKLQSKPVRPRRILHQLSSLGLSPTKRSQAHPHDEETDNSLSELLRNAEDNLLEQSQSQSQVVEQTVSEIETVQHNGQGDDYLDMQDTIPDTKLKTYSMQRSFTSDRPITSKPSETLEPGSISNGSETENDEQTDDNDIMVPSPVRTIKNLHDLRHGGENKRFHDQASFLLEGLDSERSQLSTLLELGKKLGNKDFARRFRTAELDNKVWQSCRQVSDPVTLFAAIVVMTLLIQAKDGFRLEESQRVILITALQFEQDVRIYVTSAKKKFSKINQLSVFDLRESLMLAPGLDKLQALRISPRLLSLMSMHLCSFGDDASELTSLSDALLRVLSSAEGSPLLENQLALSNLETIPSEVLVKLSSEQITLLSITLFNLLNDKSGNATPAILSVLRLLISLANSSDVELYPHLGKHYLRDFLHCTLNRLRDYREGTKQVEEIVLMLGLLVSLIDESANSKDIIISSRKASLLSAWRTHKVVKSDEGRIADLMLFVREGSDHVR